MDNKATINLTGLYGQVVSIRACDIMQIMPHRIWTEIVILGGNTIKVQESGEEVEKMLEAVEED